MNPEVGPPQPKSIVERFLSLFKRKPKPSVQPHPVQPPVTEAPAPQRPAPEPPSPPRPEPVPAPRPAEPLSPSSPATPDVGEPELPPEPGLPDVGEPEPPPLPKPEPPKPKEIAPEAASLAELGTSTFRVLPGTEWALHYKQGNAAKDTAVTSLLASRTTPAAAVASLTPDALIYDSLDLQKAGLSKGLAYAQVRNRVHDTVTHVQHYDYPRFAQFLHQMSGTTITPENAQAVYSTIASSRTRETMLSSYVQTDRERVMDDMAREARSVSRAIPAQTGMEKILNVARVVALGNDNRISYAQAYTAEELLTAQDFQFYQRIQDAYQRYARSGDEGAYGTLTQAIREYYQQSHADEEPFFSQPPSAQDEEYNPSKETASRIYFEVVPSGTSAKPYLGYYSERKRNQFNPASRRWVSTTQPQEYKTNVTGTARQTIKGQFFGSERILINVPPGHTIDAASLKTLGSCAIYRDQNGFFSLQPTVAGAFSVDFLREVPPFQPQPIQEDRELIHRGRFSETTEGFMANLQGTDMEKANAIRQYIQSRHGYPEAIMQVQEGLINNSTADNYFQNIDQASDIECYSANSLFIALARKAGLTSRLIDGHKVEKSTKGKVLIDSTTGHAWSEVWDGQKWVIVDATPSGGRAEDGEGGEGGDGGFDSEINQLEGASAAELAEAVKLSDGVSETMQLSEAQRSRIAELIAKMGLKDKEGLLKIIGDNPHLLGQARERLRSEVEVAAQGQRDKFEEQVGKMERDGFLSEPEKQRLLDQVEEGNTQGLERAERNPAFREYRELLEFAEPYVERWYDFFEGSLPTEEQVFYDEDVYATQGKLDQRALGDIHKLRTGKVMHPRTFERTPTPKFLASLLVDVSLSMGGDYEGNRLIRDNPERINNAKRLMVIFNELFSRISKKYGYIRFAQYSFADDLRVIKQFDEEWDPEDRPSEVKPRFIEAMGLRYGTNILGGLETARRDLEREKEKFPDYASSLILIGDGDDNRNSHESIRDLIKNGFGDTHVSAVMLGTEQDRETLAKFFGDQNTAVASDFDTLLNTCLLQLKNGIQAYTQQFR